MIEEVDGDSDEEESGVVETAEMRRLREEEEAKDMRERARAEQAERAGRERKGPFVDPQAAQESDELMNSLNAMNAGSSMFKQNAAPATKKADDKPKKKVTIVEEDSEEEEEDVPIKKKQPVARDGFEPSPKFTGGRPGWVFKAGPDGLGYYREGRSLLRSRRACARSRLRRTARRRRTFRSRRRRLRLRSEATAVV